MSETLLRDVRSRLPRWRVKDIVTTALAGGVVVLVADGAFHVAGIGNDVTRTVAIGLGIGAACLIDRRGGL